MNSIELLDRYEQFKDDLHLYLLDKGIIIDSTNVEKVYLNNTGDLCVCLMTLPDRLTNNSFSTIIVVNREEFEKYCQNNYDLEEAEQLESLSYGIGG